MQESLGIVLRLYKDKPFAVTLLDQTLGRIELYRTPSHTYPTLVGSLVSYQRTQRTHNFFADRITLVGLAEEIIPHDLLFLHHVLEIVTHFMPAGNHDERLFDLLLYLYRPAPNKWSTDRLLQKIFLCKIVALLGMNDAVHNRLLLTVIPYLDTPIDILDSESLHLTNEQHITTWLHRCLEAHQPLAHFKTAHFLQP